MKENTCRKLDICKSFAKLSFFISHNPTLVTQLLRILQRMFAVLFAAEIEIPHKYAELRVVVDTNAVIFRESCIP